MYGTDNSCMVAAMKSGRLQYRGVARIAENISDRELKALHEAGIRAARIGITKAELNVADTSQLAIRTAKRIKPFGWHLQFLLAIDSCPWAEELIAKLPVPCVIDHIALVRASDGIQGPGFKALLRLARLEHVWIKLIGYRSSTQLPFYPDVTPLVQALVVVAPDRCVWGTDWPHTNLADLPGYRLTVCDSKSGADPIPNDGDLADTLNEWLPDTTLRQRVLVDNPACLYDFK
jgi:predicted TIM-barrel fold metal-dependent hydrolase